MINLKISLKITLLILLCSLAITGIYMIIFKPAVQITNFIIFIPIATAVITFLLFSRFFKPIARLYQTINLMQNSNPNYPKNKESKTKITQLDEIVDELVQYIQKNFYSMDDLYDRVAQREQMNNNLLMRLNQLQKLFENANTAIFIYNIDGYLIEVNSKACKMLGYIREELLQCSFYQLQTEKALHESIEAHKTGDDSIAIRYESMFRHNNGKTFPVEIHTSAIDIDKGIIQSMVNDISERKKMESALRDSEDRFRTFMETASDLMFITNSEGQLLYVNQAMEDSLGYPKNILLELSILDILYTNKEINIKQLFDSWLSDEKQHQIQLKTRKKAILWGEIQIVGIFTDKNKLRGIRGIIRDITERKKIEESQRLTQLGKLAADVAHGIKNQLTAVIYIAEMAAMEGSTNLEKNEAIKQILEQCWEINDIVRRLLNFSTPSTGNFQPKNIHAIIDLVVSLVEKQYLRNGVKIIRQYENSIPQITIDDKQIREVFMNLIQNAYESMKGPGKIEIKTMISGKFVHINFKDTGKGIKEEEMKKIFDPFFTTKKNGTGLGVSACYGILKAHDGNLKYSSKTGKGTTAIVILPLVAPKSINSNKK